MDRIELIESQMIFESKVYGTLHFIPCKDAKKACKSCMLMHNQEECLLAPCSQFMRVDMRGGYFSIHETP